MSAQVMHKSRPNGMPIASVCGAKGYTTYLWKNTTCEKCLKQRKTR